MNKCFIHSLKGSFTDESMIGRNELKMHVKLDSALANQYSNKLELIYTSTHEGYIRATDNFDIYTYGSSDMQPDENLGSRAVLDASNTLCLPDVGEYDVFVGDTTNLRYFNSSSKYISFDLDYFARRTNLVSLNLAHLTQGSRGNCKNINHGIVQLTLSADYNLPNTLIVCNTDVFKSMSSLTKLTLEYINVVGEIDDLGYLSSLNTLKLSGLSNLSGSIEGFVKNMVNHSGVQSKTLSGIGNFSTLPNVKFKGVSQSGNKDLSWSTSGNTISITLGTETEDIEK